MQWIITIVTIAFSTQWIIMRIQKYMYVPARGRQRASRWRFPDYQPRRGAPRLVRSNNDARDALTLELIPRTSRPRRSRRAQRGWYYTLQQSKHARLILPPECITEAPDAKPLTRLTKKVARKISRRKRNGEYTGITSIDPSLLPDDAVPLLVFVNSRSGGQLAGTSPRSCDRT